MPSNDLTPVDSMHPFERILESVNLTRDSQMRMHEELKDYRDEIQRVRRQIRYPVVVCMLSAAVCLLSVFVRLV